MKSPTQIVLTEIGERPVSMTNPKGTTPELEAVARALAYTFAGDDSKLEPRAAYAERYWPKWVDEARALANSFARDSEDDLRATYVERYWPKFVDAASAAVRALPEKYAKMAGEIVGETK